MVLSDHQQVMNSSEKRCERTEDDPRTTFWGHILSAEWTQMCPGPQWESEHSTDVLWNDKVHALVHCDEYDVFRLSYTQFVPTTMSPDSLKKKNKRLQDEEKLRKHPRFLVNSSLNATHEVVCCLWRRHCSGLSAAPWVLPDNFNSCLNATDVTFYTTIVKENSLLLTVKTFTFLQIQ